jgi:cell division protein FtsI/penicillin-binding protein 2
VTRYLKTADSEWYKQRIIGVIIVTLAVFAVLLLRLFFLQVIKGEEYSRLSENNSIRLQAIDAPRGIIFDRTGKLLVDNRPSFDVSIVPKDAKPLDPTLAKLSKFLTVPQEELVSKVAGQKGILTYQPIMLKQDIGRNTLAFVAVNKYDLPGVIVNAKLRRHYINKRVAAHLLGYLGEINPGELKSGKYPNTRRGDLIGKYGAEKAFDNFLRGNRGGRQVEVNATGQVVKVLKTVNTIPGHNIYLTIDLAVQEKAEELLTGITGAVVALESTSGQILALASSPTCINLDHETQGLIPTAAWKKRRTGVEWQEGETLSVAIGQGFNLVTPLQMAALASGLANGGIKYQPEILKQIESADGTVIKKTEPQIIGQFPVSPETMALIKKGLWQVVNSDTGTAKGARFPGIDISGKTGTAQVLSRKEDEEETPEEDIPDHLKPHAWFIAYAPSENPKIAVAVVVENGEHGSSAAAPIAREVIKSYLLKDQLGPQLLANRKAQE